MIIFAWDHKVTPSLVPKRSLRPNKTFLASDGGSLKRGRAVTAKSYFHGPEEIHRILQTQCPAVL